jgi:type VI secretion system protein ImpJ
MRAPRRPVWWEGMLLSPQHLQAADRYHEALLAARIWATAPDDHGVLAVELDPAALAAGQVRVSRFAGILPDGLAVAFDDGDADAPPPRPFAEHLPPAARSVEVFLAVPRERDGVPTYAEEGQAQRIRFVSSSRPLEDATAPGQPVSVSLARPNAVLLFGDEPREDFEALQIAELGRDAAGRPALVEGYLPPALRVGACPSLVARLRDVLARAVAKGRELAEGRRAREAATGEATAQDVSRLLQLVALNTFVPVLSQLAEAPEESPRSAHRWLSALAGQLSAFAADSDPATLPRYVHADLRSSFEPLLARLDALLGGLASAQYLVVPLEQRAGGLHLARIGDERLLQAPLFLGVRSELPEAQVADAVPRLCKMASTAEIQGLVQAAAPGLSLTWLPRPPPQLPPREKTQWFAVGTGDRHWQSILANRNMAIYLPPPFDPAKTKVDLLAVPAKTESAAPAAAVAGAGRAPNVRRF